MSWSLGNPFGSSAPSKDDNKINKGDLPDIVGRDVIAKLQDLTQTITDYKKDNTKILVEDIIKYNEMVSNNKKITLPKNVIDKITTYHNTVLNELRNDKKPKEAIKEFYDKRLDEFAQSLNQNQDLRDNPEIAKQLGQVVSNIKLIKTSSSFFEYKYIQMNLFMVYFVQKVYNVLEKYTEDVTEYMILQNTYRQKLMINFMQQIVKILESEKNVGFSEDDQKNFMGMIDNITSGFQKTEQKVKDDLAKMKTGAVAQFADEIMKSDTNSKKNTSSAVVNNRIIDPLARSKTYGGGEGNQKGGMIRDLSILPQKFFEMLK